MHHFRHHDSMAPKWDISTSMWKNAKLAIGTELMENGGEGVRHLSGRIVAEQSLSLIVFPKLCRKLWLTFWRS
tara:strand:+ start:3940 stop:4158 length:219 start_codon:yes stop_codon:yes gene_type:complete